MAFSSIQSDAKTELEVILNIADKFGAIMDQKKLRDIVQFAYGLSDEEKERTKTAQEFIKQYTDLVDKNNKQIADMADAEAKRQESVANAAAALDATQKDILAKQTILDATLKDIAEKTKALDDQTAAIKQASSDLSAGNVALAAAKRELDVQKAKLSDDIDALAIRQKQVAEYESTLKSKALQLQKLTEGM